MGKKIFLLVLAVCITSCVTVNSPDTSRLRSGESYAGQAGIPEGFIKEWLISVHFPTHLIKRRKPGKKNVYDHTPPCVGLDTDYLTEHGGEKKIMPAEGMSHTKKGRYER
jgi:hypothetical protein